MKICLIGSSRFMDRYLEVNRRLSLAGHVVYSIATRSSSEQYDPARIDNLTVDEKETLDLVHLLKIQESEALYLITDSTGYIGDSTKREIKWAQMLKVPVYIGNHALEYHLIKNSIDPDCVGTVRGAIEKDAKQGNYDCTEVGNSLVGALFMGGLTQSANPPKAEEMPS